ncbi:RCC1 domain-containing protein [Plantactinospora siamensis]|uniref:RCC1 domain-containing protein n=1 Tax=Plantactinospora siamensis TaxID=555372 RepID=A0ABV6NR15_9ACTN
MPSPVLVATPSPVDGPVITEQSSGDIGTGTVTFRLSTGFAWYSGGMSVTVTDIGRCGKDTSLRLGADNAQSVTIYPNGPDLTVLVGRPSSRKCRGELRFDGVSVHALHTGSGTVSYAGTARITGIPTGTILSQVHTGPGPVGVGWGGSVYGNSGQPGGSRIPMQIDDARVPGVGLGVSDWTSYAIQADGTVLGWGRYADGANESQVPVLVQGVTDAAAVTGGSYDNLALRRDGSVLTWSATTAPTVVSGVSGAVAVEAYDRTFFAVQGDGTLMAWGAGDAGQLGTGTRTSSATPMAVPGLTGVVAVSACEYTVLALTADGSVWQWGWDGQTFNPDGSGALVTPPQRVAGLPPAKAIAAGYLFGLMVGQDGTVWGWGRNNNGELGDGTTITPTAPVRAAGLAGIDQIASLGSSSYAVASDGTAYEWGGPSTDPAVASIVRQPTPIWGVDRVRSILAGNGTVLATVE